MPHNYIVRTGPYNVFGTPAVLKELTATFVSDTNAVQLSDGMATCTMEISFTAGTNGEFVEIQVETSEDEGFDSPTNFFILSENNYPDAAPIATLLGIEGIPYSSPKDATTVATTTYNRSYTIQHMNGARWMRFSARSTVGSGFGTAWIRVRFSEAS